MFTSKANVEDFIWAIRQRNENIKEHEAKSRASVAPRKTSDVTQREKRTKILASLVPDEVIRHVSDYSHKYYNACLLFGDVSGFTELTEKYNQEGKGGPSRLTLVLNGYIGALIQEIMSFGGDIFKFSGDAFLSIWKCDDENQIMREYVHQALDCALVIQKNYGTFQTDVGTYLRVKLAIAAGPVIFSLIGNEKYSHYIIIGKPIYDVKDAEHQSKAGEIMVAPSAWYHVNSTDYISIDVDGVFRKVIGLGPSWRHIKGETKYSQPSGVMRDTEQEEVEVVEDEEEEDSEDAKLSDAEEEFFAQKRNLEFALRPIIQQAGTLTDSFRKFVLPSVMSCIDQNEPIEYLTEMRRTVIMFVNLTSKRSTYDALAHLVNECYIEICQIAEKFGGCVNKVSLFDKDIMFVLVFGLRGFKHDLECQYALRCASSIFETLNNHKALKTISIACTTGKTYCGIVGHTLRREYTVMSLTVNKAARIMMNYPDRVACDSSTFQQSKLEARFFILQVYKPLKGITNPGPIYEYQETDTVNIDQASVTVNYYPILGRDKELEMFLNNLKVFVDNAQRIREKLPNYTRMFIIRGGPRQGKTRLLEECIFKTSTSIPIVRLMLSQSYTKMDYGTVRQVFYQLFSFEHNISKEKIKRKLARSLTSLYKPYLCCLNDIFEVDFETPENFVSISEVFKEAIMQKIVKNICYSFLRSVCVVSLDKAKFMDRKSWKVLLSMLSCRYLFFLLSLASPFDLDKDTERILTHRNVQVVHLTNIPRLYHAGMACQILNVFAISADLENLLHKKSNGNPGWMETLLISLKQAHHVFIRNADYRTVNQYGLVTPPLYMMRRMSRENILKWKQILEENKSKDPNKTTDVWSLYIDTCREEAVDIIVREKIHQSVSNDKYLPVCFLNPKCNFIDIDAELTEEIKLVMLFDTLTYQEQLLLKVSSVLGDCFPRTLLVYVMQASESARATAMVVRSLFEKKVLCCARGDFSEGGNYLLIRNKMTDPSRDMSVNCFCLGLYYNEAVKDLPQYASCGYMRFISSSFRETTYNLLTDQQKKTFHARAAKCLLRDTRKCTSCGGAFFDLNTYSKLELTIKPRFVPKRNLSDDQSETSLSNYGSLFSGTLNTDSASRTSASISGRSIGYRSLAPSIGTNIGYRVSSSLEDNDNDSFYTKDFGIMNPFKVMSYRKHHSLTKPFTSADFQSCRCLLILDSLMNQLRHHYFGSGQWLEMVNATIDCVKVCLENTNYPQGFLVVKKGLNFLATSADSLGVSRWKVPILEAKLYVWQGVLLLTQQQAEDGLKMFYLAMTKFGFPFPRRRLNLHIKLWSKKLRQKLRMYLCPDSLHDSRLSAEDIEVVDGLSACLNKMFIVFINSDRLQHAELSAVWSLTKALQSGNSLFQTCNAFGNMILMVNYRKNRYFSMVLEVHAQRFCHRRKYGIDPPELQRIIRMYYTIFELRLARAEFEKSLHIGYILSRLTVAANDYLMTIKTLARIILVLLLKLFLSECISIMQELSYHVTELDDAKGKAEYYASVLIFHIETGYNVIPFKDVEQYYKEECFVQPCLEQRKFLVFLRCWYSRTYQWEAAKIVDKKLVSMPGRADPIEFVLRLTFSYHKLYDLEYQLMLLVYKTNKRNIYDRRILKKKINEIWKILKTNIHQNPILKTSVYLLKAYEGIILDKESRMQKYLNKAKKFANNQENVLMQKTIDFLEKYWMEVLSEEEEHLWMRHAEPDNYMEYNQLTHGDNIMPYPLPIPLFY